MYEEIVHCW